MDLISTEYYDNSYSVQKVKTEWRKIPKSQLFSNSFLTLRRIFRNDHEAFQELCKASKRNPRRPIISRYSAWDLDSYQTFYIVGGFTEEKANFSFPVSETPLGFD